MVQPSQRREDFLQPIDPGTVPSLPQSRPFSFPHAQEAASGIFQLRLDITGSPGESHRLTSNPSLHFSAMVGGCDVGTHLPTVPSCWLHFPGYTETSDDSTIRPRKQQAVEKKMGTGQRMGRGTNRRFASSTLNLLRKVSPTGFSSNMGAPANLFFLLL